MRFPCLRRTTQERNRIPIPSSITLLTQISFSAIRNQIQRQPRILICESPHHHDQLATEEHVPVDSKQALRLNTTMINRLPSASEMRTCRASNSRRSLESTNLLSQPHGSQRRASCSSHSSITQHPTSYPNTSTMKQNTKPSSHHHDHPLRCQFNARILQAKPNAVRGRVHPLGTTHTITCTSRSS